MILSTASIKSSSAVSSFSRIASTIFVPLAPHFQQQFHRLLCKMLVVVLLGPFQIPAVIPRYRLTKGIKHLDDPPLVLFGGSIHHLSLLFADSSAGCFASSHNQNTSNTRKPENFEKIFLFYFSGSVGVENHDIYLPICSPPKRKKSGRSATRQTGPLGKIALPCYALFYFRRFQRLAKSNH